ncbi:MAG TPA: NTP transferase domain-containing protein, partial [Spirochaetota bacterium]|nr:NTP transferase domain-containing protein [Spirochaetota bacterium]
MCGQNKIAAVVLAAGYSSRMGDFKPLMKLDGITVIESTVRGLQGAGISDIMVVVGFRAPEVIEILPPLEA